MTMQGLLVNDYTKFKFTGSNDKDLATVYLGSYTGVYNSFIWVILFWVTDLHPMASGSE